MAYTERNLGEADRQTPSKPDEYKVRYFTDHNSTGLDEPRTWISVTGPIVTTTIARLGPWKIS